MDFRDFGIRRGDEISLLGGVVEGIISGSEMQYQIGELKSYRLYYEKMIAPRMAKWTGRITPVDDVTESPILSAIVNHGRWMVKCPFCAGAEVLYLERLQFMCLSCFNAEAQYKFLRVKLPKAWRRIEEILMRRPIQNRNYEGETLKQLLAENEREGVE